MINRRFLFVLVLLGVFINTFATIKEVFNFNFGKSGNVSFTAAPSQIKSQTGEDILSVQGAPLIYMDAPESHRMKGEGCIFFKTQQDWYENKEIAYPQNGNILFEVWARPRLVDHGDQHQSHVHVIAAIGSGEGGYTFAQVGKNLQVYSSKKGSVTLAPIVPEVWVHIAVKQENGKAVFFLNGEEKETLDATPIIMPGLYVGGSAKGNVFHGDLYQARVSTFQPGKFDGLSDFAIDYQAQKATYTQNKQHRRQIIKMFNSLSGNVVHTKELTERLQEKDWLIHDLKEPCQLVVEKSKDGETARIRIENGLVDRTFYYSDNLACVGYRNLSNGAEYLRGIKPEARIMIDSVWYEVGGLKGQPEYAYLLDSWYKDLYSSPRSFQFDKLEIGDIVKRYDWKPKFNSITTSWPAKGLHVSMIYKPTGQMPEVENITVKVNYEIYEGLPTVAKWVEVINNSDEAKVINKIESEILALSQDQFRRIYAQSDYSFAMVGGAHTEADIVDMWTNEHVPFSGSPVRLIDDTDYNTWAGVRNDEEILFGGKATRNLLVSSVPMGPNVDVTKTEPFQSFCTFELLMDSDDLERNTLGWRRVYRKLAPQTTESLLCGGITSNDPIKLKGFIDQMAEVGMERLDVMAWPGIQYDKLDAEYVNMWKDIASYAKERGIITGGYELMVASRGRGEKYDCIDPKTNKPGCNFGQSVCLASEWKDVFFPKFWEFKEKTGLDVYPIDGPYHGDACASKNHPHHKGLEDSQWKQWSIMRDFTREMQNKGMFVLMPDNYFWHGSTATGMGYREAASNLTLSQQMLLGRQYIYDGTRTKLPTMGWMTLQLVGFYSNDPKIGLEPLCDNLDKYEANLIQLLGSGCQLTIRGNRLYDTPETKQLLSKYIDWFKKYRDILTSDIIHVSRPTGRDLDCIMHVNPFIQHKGMVIVFNPTDRDITKEMRLPLYYSGLKDKATVVASDGTSSEYMLDQKGNLLLPVSIKAQGASWFLIEE